MRKHQSYWAMDQVVEGHQSFRSHQVTSWAMSFSMKHQQTININQYQYENIKPIMSKNYFSFWTMKKPTVFLYKCVLA